MKKEVLLIGLVLVFGIFGYVFYDSVSLSPMLDVNLESRDVKNFNELLEKNELVVSASAQLDSDLQILMNPSHPETMQDVIFSAIDLPDPTSGNLFYYWFSSEGALDSVPSPVKGFSEAPQSVTLNIYDDVDWILLAEATKEFYVGDCSSDEDCAGDEYCHLSDGNCYQSICESNSDCPSGFGCIVSSGNCAKEVTTDRLSDLIVSSSGDSIDDDIHAREDFGVVETYFCRSCGSNSDCDSDYCGDGCCYDRYCVDSDGGINPDVIGSAYYCYNGPTSFCGLPWLDNCGGSGVSEKYCDENGVVASEEVLCSGTCFNGKCVECYLDEGCNDDLFCNGVESCLDNSCQSSGNPCEVGETCNEDTNSCDVGNVISAEFTWTPHEVNVDEQITFELSNSELVYDNGFYANWYVDGIYKSISYIEPFVYLIFSEAGEHVVRCDLYNSSTYQIIDSVEKTVYVSSLPVFSVIGSLEGSGDYNYNNLLVNGDAVYLAGGNSLVAVDVSNKELPYLMDEEYFEGYARQIVIEGDILAVATGRGGVFLYDISNSLDPVFISRVNVDEYNSRISGLGFYAGYLYLIGDQGIHIVDVSSVESPEVIKTVNLLEDRKKIAGLTNLVINENRGYFSGIYYSVNSEGAVIKSNEDYGFILDFSDSLNPTITNEVDLRKKGRFVLNDNLLGCTAYGFDEKLSASSGMWFYDSSNLNDLVLLGRIFYAGGFLPKNNQGLVLGGSLAYSFGFSDVREIDLADFDNLVVEDLIDVGSQIYSIGLGEGGVIYTGMGGGKILYVIDEVVL